MSLQLRITKPTIKILLYTDDPSVINDGRDTLGLATMIDHLHAHAPAFARLEVKWLSRNYKGAGHRLDARMLGGYNEIWFFGIHQLSIETTSPPWPPKGGVGSELDAAEVGDLNDWMRRGGRECLVGGGVLMTGDHANPRPPGHAGPNPGCPDHCESESFLGLGRALGRCVPRAGLLRQWEGKPTSLPTDSFNTQDPVPGISPDGPQLQLDENPLNLLLPRFDEKGNPSPDGQVHPLFFYKSGRWIRVFPDHLHEGAVILPDKFDETVWPKVNSVQPKPQVVACGIDHRDFKLIKILAAYDGDRAGVGRVVADSTWHHYLNENLRKFGPPAPEESAADQIGQFYANLAIWLSPLSIRREMAYVMFTWLAKHLLVLEELRLPAGDDDELGTNKMMGIGRAAYAVLTEVASPCEIHELILAAVPVEYREKFDTMYFPDRGVSLTLFPSKEVVLGCIVNSFQQATFRNRASGNGEDILDLAQLTVYGFRRALQGHVENVSQSALAIANALKVKQP